MSSRNNLKSLGLASHNYTDAFKKFPIGADFDGKIGKHGWYARCMPFLEASPLYNQISFRLHWEHPYHRHIFAYNYACSLRPNEEKSFSTEGYGLFHYQGNPNVFRKNRCVLLTELTAGASNTWLVGEVDGQYQPWGYPFNWRPLTAPFNMGNGSFGGSRRGFQLVMADDSVRFISDSIDTATTRLLADAPPIVSPDETVVPSRLFQAAKAHRFRTEYIEVRGFEDQKGGSTIIVRYDDEVPTMVDLSEVGRHIDLLKIAKVYPTIRTLIGIPLNDRSFDAFLQFKHLETLSVGSIELSQENFAKLKNLVNLKELVTQDQNVDLQQLSDLLLELQCYYCTKVGS